MADSDNVAIGLFATVCSSSPLSECFMISQEAAKKAEEEAAAAPLDTPFSITTLNLVHIKDKTN